MFKGITILLMGSKEEDVPVEPVEKTVFAEDLTESELASAVRNCFLFHLLITYTRLNIHLDLPLFFVALPK